MNAHAYVRVDPATLRFLSLHMRIASRRVDLERSTSGESGEMSGSVPVSSRILRADSKSIVHCRFRRANPVGKTDRGSVGRAREIGWRQVCREVAAPGRLPELQQGVPWSFLA